MGNNYTVTIPRNDCQRVNALTWKELHEADFLFNSPFQLTLADGEVFYADQVVRVVPKRRLVAFGTWQGKPVVAKLFFDPKKAMRHIEKDVAGVKVLQENKIPTPALYYQGISADKRISILIFERIFEASSLEEIWKNRESVEAIWPILQSVIIELATQHVLGVMQNDLHLKNFLLTEKVIYTLDGGEVELFPPLLPKKQSMNSLALLLAQFGIGMQAYYEKLFRFYAKSRGWVVKKADVMELLLTIKKWNETRWQRYEKKIFRDCTDFASFKDWHSSGMYDRDYAFPELLNFIKHPDAVFQDPKAVFLKNGRSSTVIKITLDNRDFVIKRYNMKSIWHLLRRTLRKTRAHSSWRLAQKFNLFGVRTAKPVAFLERKWLGFRGKSYYVTEYVSDMNARDFLLGVLPYEEKLSDFVKRVIQLLKNIAKLEVTHGDLKITNILVDAHGQPVMIDLDGTIEHISLSSLRQAWHKEIKRFLKNFDSHPSLREKFERELKL